MSKRKAQDEQPPRAIAKGVAAVVAVLSGAAAIYGLFTDIMIAVLAFIGMIFGIMLLLVVGRASKEISNKGEKSRFYSILVKALSGFIMVYFMVGTLCLFPSLMESLKRVVMKSTARETNALSPCAELMKAAFGAFNDTNWDVALEKANSCIQRCEGRAIAIQGRYQSNNAPEISPEHVSDTAIRNDILSRGPLNDVAACYIVIGRTYLAQYKQEPSRNAADAIELLNRAKKAFEKAKTFTYAYVYDPKNGFWRPAVKASEALSREPLVSH